LTTTGRKTARAHTTPVAVLTYGAARYIVAGFDGSDWVRNARATGHGLLQRGRSVESVILIEVPSDQRAEILRQFAQKVRGGQAFLTVAPDAPLSAFVDAAPRHPIFRLATGEPPNTTADAERHSGGSR
jgi:hypothetical protein